MERIESKNNPRIKQTAALRDKKARDETGLFFFEGAHLLEEYLSSGHTPECVYATDKAINRYMSLISGISDLVCAVSEDAFAKISTENAPQGLITVSKRLNNITSGVSDLSGGCMMLASVRDAGNVGTVIRSAAAFGSRVILSADCADIYGYKTVRASMGAVFKLGITVSYDLSSEITLRAKKGIRTFAAALDKDALLLRDGVIGRDDCVMIGNEGQGIPPSLLQKCYKALLIPMSEGCESLNASAAAAVLLWEMRRSRLGK